jgi:hypothetical protein
MPLILYPIFLVVAVIVFYILGKKSTPMKEVVKTVEVERAEEVLYYHEETEEGYLLRCQNTIVAFFNEVQVPYLVAPDYSYYQIKLAGHDEYQNEIRIEPYFAQGNKYITFDTQITSILIPNDKLSAVSELINRINFELLFCGLSLDYTNRALNYKITYKVGNQRIFPEYFWFNAKAVNSAVNFVPFLQRVIDNEEPVLVALDYLSN